MGADQEPGRRASVEAEANAARPAPCRTRTIRPEAPRADDATADLALRMDPAYEKISRRFHGQPGKFADAFAARLVQADPPRHGADRPLPRPAGARNADLAGPDPGAVDHPLIDAQDIAALKARSSLPACPVGQLVTTAWASASTFRGSDKRGGANGARIRLAPQKDWEVNQPAQLAKVLQALEASRRHSTARQSGGKKVSLADLIVLGR
jgi:catalase-peroxidase